MQVSKYLRQGKGMFIFYCPGCKEAHQFSVPRWTFQNNDFNQPTFTPSLRLFDVDTTVTPQVEHTLCHLNLTAGKIIFHGDCDHELKGQTVPLPELPPFMQDDGYGDGNP